MKTTNYITVAQYANKCGVTTATVYRWAESKTNPLKIHDIFGKKAIKADEPLREAGKRGKKKGGKL